METLMIHITSDNNMNHKMNIMFRYAFQPEMTAELERFAKIHQDDDRHTFKASWQTWTNLPEIKVLIQSQIKEFMDSGFKGDVIDKMFKSARYYYRKKKDKEEDLIKSKKYMSMSSEMIDLMDRQIRLQLSAMRTCIRVISPAEAYALFCEENETIIQKEIKMFVGKLNSNEMEEKIKKTYKNRYYIHRRRMLIQ